MAGVYNRGKLKLTNGSVTWTSADIRILLVEASYTYDPDHNFVADVVADELSGGNYVRKALANKVGPTEDDANDRVSYDADDLTWTALQAAAGTPTQAIAYLHTGSDATAELIARMTLTTPPAPNGGDWSINWSASGLFALGD